MKNNIINPAIVKVLSVVAVISLVGIDQLIKYFVDLYLKPISAVTLIPKVLQFSYYENDGAMMGMMSGKTTIMTVFSVLCLLLVGFILFKGMLGYGLEFWCVIFITAGGIGNLIDRIFRGYVIDYIEVLFVDFYIFNFADCLVTCAAIIIIIKQIWQFVKESKNNKEEENALND